MGKTSAVVWIGVLCVSVLSSCSKPPVVRQQLTLGMPREPLCALMAIAVGQGFMGTLFTTILSALGSAFLGMILAAAVVIGVYLARRRVRLN